MKTTDTELALIEETIKLYFTGTYQGDVAMLKRAFHPDVHITGIINNTLVDWTLSDFIERVTTKPTAMTRGDVYNKEIISIDRTNDIAMAKARVVVGELIFTDYITLLKIDDRWIIRNKSFTG